jgi:hypothetical protein
VIALSGRRARGRFSVALALGLAAAACAGSSQGQNPSGQTGNNGGGGNNGGSNSLVAGLSSNLDSLTSYQFTESMAGSSTGSEATPAAAAAVRISGIVVNSPMRSLSMNASGAQYILVGNQAWASNDVGVSWTAIDPTDTSLTDLLPGKNYQTWFDAYATGFKVQGDETKNGVACVHYKGDTSLGSLYGVGASGGFQADLWVARDGNYPVSGAYGFTATSSGAGVSFGYSFDITNVNDGSNKVTPPTNVVAIPT